MAALTRALTRALVTHALREPPLGRTARLQGTGTEMTGTGTIGTESTEIAGMTEIEGMTGATEIEGTIATETMTGTPMTTATMIGIAIRVVVIVMMTVGVDLGLRPAPAANRLVTVAASLCQSFPHQGALGGRLCWPRHRAQARWPHLRPEPPPRPRHPQVMPLTCWAWGMHPSRRRQLRKRPLIHLVLLLQPRRRVARRKAAEMTGRPSGSRRPLPEATREARRAWEAAAKRRSPASARTRLPCSLSQPWVACKWVPWVACR
mmetsp:Transcript_44014/g.113794  ORF Transcript_44014/g.113794 Transcript_44014/m.113794 type:complete len:263 (-) Transcript_44014:685-1473(-)